MIFSKPLTGMLIAFIWGILQFLAMALDPITASLYNTPGFGVNEFAVYLFSLPEFDARLVVQVAVIVFSLRGYLLLKKLSIR